MRSLCAVTLALLAACGSDSTPKQIDAAKSIDSPGGSALLTVKDAPTGTPWCSVTIGTNAASLAGVQTVPITTSGAITLKVSPNSGFKLDTNMWHHTDGDSGNGDSGTVSGSTSTATVTVTAGTSKCVWVCCPGTSGSPACPTSDQCL